MKIYLNPTPESTECMNMLNVVSISFGFVSQRGTSGGGDLITGAPHLPAIMDIGNRHCANESL